MPDTLAPARAALAAPTPAAPVDGATVARDAATFRWTAPPGAAAFDLRVASASDPGTPVVELAGLATTEATVADALPAGLCVWWVRRADGPWSAAASFVAGTPADLEVARREAEERARAARAEPEAPAGPPPAPVWPHATGDALPGATAVDWSAVPGFGAPFRATRPAADAEPPRVLAPLGGEVVDAVSVSLLWAPVPGAVGYDVELSPDPAFGAHVLALDAGSATELALPAVVPATGRRLHWRVRARTDRGATRWSPYGRFYPAASAAADAFRAGLDAARAADRRLRDYERDARERDLALVPAYERGDAVGEAGTAAAMLAMMVSTIAIVVAVLVASIVF